MALVRVYCGLASADDSVRSASAAPLTIAVVDDAGRLLGVHEISDDPAGYAKLGALLVERTTGFSDAAVAADSDDHVVTSLLTAAGRPLVVVDDDDADDFAERFSDDESPEEIQAPAAARRAVGLARALQAGAIAAVNLATPRDLVSYKPVLAAHVAMLNGRHSAAASLREVLRELYPAALRAYPDPAHHLALAVLDAVPEPGRLTGRGDPGETAREVAAELARAGAGSHEQVIAAVTALQVAISESPRRGGVNKSLAPAAAEAVRQSIAAVRSCDAACTALVGTLSARAMPQTSNPNVGRRAARRAADPVLAPVPNNDSSRFGRRGRPEPATTGSGPATPRPMTAPPVAPEPIGPPPMAPAAANGLPTRTGNPGNRPVSVPPPPPGMTPITPGTRPVPSTRTPGAPSSVQPAARSTPADAGEPFRPTLTNAEITRSRAERQRTVIPARPNTRQPAAPANGAASASPTDYSLPMPTQRPAQETPEPGSRANWPLLNPGDDAASTPPAPAAASVSSPPATGRVRPPWQDMPKEPPSLRLVDAQLNGRGAGSGLDPMGGPPPLRLVDGDPRSLGANANKLTALDRSTSPPVPADGSDGDLLIFAAARSAWFTGHEEPERPDWANPNDSGWRAAEKASTPAVAAETSAGLPKRVPQANLVPGSPLRDERPLRIVRDAASIAAHTTGYFRGWRRGQEIGGFAMGGRPGREAAGGWDFTRDGQPADDYRNNNGNTNGNNAGYGNR
ncbi:transposase [Actinoplanes sp. GCM10030250]|uniref:transposase n=1 Tax=Actinoplanes sp. GCM10030250 TaxID=3273376 RepID=UPI003620E0A5